MMVEPLTTERLKELWDAWHAAMFWMLDAQTAPEIINATITGRGLAEHCLDEYFNLLERHIPQ